MFTLLILPFYHLVPHPNPLVIMTTGQLRYLLTGPNVHLRESLAGSGTILGQIGTLFVLISKLYQLLLKM